jgi:carbon-monoxide dehydrogenase medium subunit
LPLLRYAIQHIAHFQIRNKGTVGGNLVNADPASELPAMSLALDAEFAVLSLEGQRIVPAHEFFITSMTTVVGPQEVLASIKFHVPPVGSGWGFHEVARRAGDYALAGSAAVITLDANGTCTRARIALFGVSSTPVRARAAEDVLVGQKYSPDLLKAAAHSIQSEIDPEPDVHVTAQYRRDTAEALTVRALDDAFRRAKAPQ